MVREGGGKGNIEREVPWHRSSSFPGKMKEEEEEEEDVSGY